MTHVRNGEPTGFKDKFLAAIGKSNCVWLKLHTIRANYELWKKRFDEIATGKAQLSIRQWSGKPYRSKQVELAILTKDDGIGMQELLIKKKYGVNFWDYDFTIDGKKVESLGDLGHNDGLSLADWLFWFENYDLSKPLVIIHFTSFRY